MSKSIPLSPKHGLNPTIPVCFFCGEQKNEVVLLGRVGGKKDLEAPRTMLMDYVPCEECQKKFAQGLLVIEVVDYPVTENQFEITEGYYPTGRYFVVKPKSEEEMGKKCLMLKEEFDVVFANVL